jgi:hypothetical protein
MRGFLFYSRGKRRSIWRVLALAYMLLLQSILGPAVANAHAFAMAQHEALGLGMLCLEDGQVVVADPGKSAPQEQAPQGDCLSCKIACASTFGVAALPLPEAAPLYIISGLDQWVPALPTDEILPRPARYTSDLATRAPPSALI